MILNYITYVKVFKVKSTIAAILPDLAMITFMTPFDMMRYNSRQSAHTLCNLGGIRKTKANTELIFPLAMGIKWRTGHIGDFLVFDRPCQHRRGIDGRRQGDP